VAGAEDVREKPLSPSLSASLSPERGGEGGQDDERESEREREKPLCSEQRTSGLVQGLQGSPHKQCPHFGQKCQHYLLLLEPDYSVR
jgi:hypothetical protein